jgi:hypothetical protein
MSIRRCKIFYNPLLTVVIFLCILCYMSYFFEKERAFQRRKLSETLQKFQDEYFPISRNTLGPSEGYLEPVSKCDLNLGSIGLLKFNTVITGTLLRRIITSDDGSIYRNNNHVSIEMMGSSGRIIDANKTINLPRGNRNSYQFFRTHWLSELVYDTSICSSNYDMSLEHAEPCE